MPAADYLPLECEGSACQLRFPGEPGVLCPMCKAPTRVCGERAPNVPPQEPSAARPLDTLVDNVRSVFNVGSIFRTADGAGVGTVHLCGIAPTPDHPSMAKTSLGAERTVAWTHGRNAVTVATVLVRNGATLWALESTTDAVDVFEAARTRPADGLVLVVGNEVTGIDPAVLSLCERRVSLAMRGNKQSLNVATAFGIAAYVLTTPAR